MSLAERFGAEVVGPLSQILMSRFRHWREEGLTPDCGEDFDFLVFVLSRLRDGRAQLAQDLWVLFELQDKKRGYFVEFGAGDGEILSNTWVLETKYRWKGILAEPNATFHARLKKRKAFVSKECVAQTSGETVVFNLTDDPHLSTLDAFSSADMHAKAREGGRRESVRTISLNDLLDRYEAPETIDYLSIDTEGSELMILEAFDFSRRQFGLISVEHNFGRTRDAIHALLVKHGYRRKFAHLTEFDDWYVHDEALARLRPKKAKSANRKTL